MDLGYGRIVKFDHDFVGREALEKMASRPHREKVTLAWNGEDVARAMGTLFDKGDPVKYIDLPLSNYSTWPNDKVLKDGKLVGVSTFSGYSANERSMLSLAMLDAEHADPGTEVTLVWGRKEAARRNRWSSAMSRPRSARRSAPRRTRRSSGPRIDPTRRLPSAYPRDDDRRRLRTREELRVSASDGPQGLDRDRLTWMYEQMVRIREFEERVKGTFEEHPGVIRGHTHLADGAEASIVGSVATLGPDDQFFATYRCHGYPIARGTDPKAIMAEIYGRKDGLCRGLGGSMHLTDVSNGFLGTSGIVGAGIPHATGAAWAAQIRGKGQVVLCFFGDGASKQGAFFESLNIASLWKLPIVYVMENNGYNVHTRTEQEDANRAHGEDLSVKAKAFSMPGVTIDGRDPIEVYETVGAAVARALGRRADARRVADVPPLGTRQHHRPARRSPPLPRARGDREVRRARGVRGGEAGRPGAGFPRAARRRGHAHGRGGGRDRCEGPRGDAGRRRLRRRESLPRRPDRARVRLRLGGDRPMAHELPYIAAIVEAIQLEMERDETVLYFGQNMATTENEPFVDAFGKDRVRVTPISETAEIGIAIGAALAGFRPVIELYMTEFMLVAMDQVINEAPRFRGMSGGQVKVPIVLKAGYGFTAGWAGQHTGTMNALFMGVPGLKVAVPSTAADAKGLMATAIRDDNPVVYLHHYLLTLEHGEVPDGEHLVPFGEAAIRREGGDVTIVGTGWTVDRALAAAERLASEGIQAEVIDPRTLEPLDTQTILESVEKTGRLVLVDQATRHASASTVIAGEVAEHGFASLKAPIVQVTGLDATIPYSEPLEAFVLPDEDKIVAAVQQVVGTAPVTA